MDFGRSIWGCPHPEHYKDTGDTKTVLQIQNLNHTVTALELQELLTRVRDLHENPETIRGICIRQHPLGISPRTHTGPYRPSSAMVLVSSENIASRIKDYCDGMAVMGRTIRIYLCRISERKNEILDEPLVILPPLLRGSSTDLNRYVSIFNTNAIDPPFHVFPKLPPEIRIMIWKLYIVESVYFRQIVQIEWLGSYRGFKSRTPVPICLQINRESRHEAEKLFQPVFGTNISNPKIRAWLGFSKIYLAKTRIPGVRETSNGRNSTRMALCRLFQSVHQSQLNRIECLCFDVGMWFPRNGEPGPTASNFRLQLPLIKYVHVVLSKGIVLDEHKSARIDELPFDFKDAWQTSREVEGVRGHLRRQWKHIKHAFYEEAALNPSWVKPRVRAWNVTRGGKHLEYYCDDDPKALPSYSV